MAVKFTKTTQVGTLYNEGEIAGFDDETEKQLVDAGVAEPLKAEKAPAKGQQ